MATARRTDAPDPDSPATILQNRLDMTGENVRSLPLMPAAMRTRVQRTRDGIVLEIPGPPPELTQFIPAVITLFIALFVGAPLVSVTDALPIPPVLRYGVPAIVALVSLAGAVRSFMRGRSGRNGSSTYVTVTPSFVRVEMPEGSEPEKVEIPAGELEDLLVGSTAPIVERIEEYYVEHPPAAGPDSGAGSGPASALTWTRTVRRRSWGPGPSRPWFSERTSAQRAGGSSCSHIPRTRCERPIPRALFALLDRVGTSGITARSASQTVTFGQGLSESEAIYLHALIRKTLAG